MRVCCWPIPEHNLSADSAKRISSLGGSSRQPTMICDNTDSDLQKRTLTQLCNALSTGFLRVSLENNLAHKNKFRLCIDLSSFHRIHTPYNLIICSISSFLILRLPIPVFPPSPNHFERVDQTSSLRTSVDLDHQSRLSTEMEREPYTEEDSIERSKSQGDRVTAIEKSTQPDGSEVIPNGGLKAWLQVAGTFFVFFNTWYK
jgi:hypothetical protein